MFEDKMSKLQQELEKQKESKTKFDFDNQHK